MFSDISFAGIVGATGLCRAVVALYWMLARCRVRANDYNESLVKPAFSRIRSAPPGARRTQAVVLFDGVCNLCNGSVQFIVARDPAAYFLFAALESEAARGLLGDSGLDGPFPDSVALMECGRVYTRSTAALRIARRLCFPWPLLYGLMIVPRPLRDAGYDFIARHRYGWFGKRDACMIPAPDLRARFLT